MHTAIARCRLPNMTVGIAASISIAVATGTAEVTRTLIAICFAIGGGTVEAPPHASSIVIEIAIYIGHDGVLSSGACGLPMPLAMPYAARGAPSVLVRCAVLGVPVLAQALRHQLRSQGRRSRDEFATLSHLHAVRCFEHGELNERMCVRLGVESVPLTTRSTHPCQL